MKKRPSRRRLLTTTSVLAATALTRANQTMPTTVAPTSARPASEPFGYCLNTSTIRGANLTIVEAIEVAAKAGFTGIEPWISEIADYVKKGGSLKDLAKRISDLGLTVEDAIGFDEWIVDDDVRRTRGLEAMAKDMGTVAEIGGKRIAAPAIGAHRPTDPVIDPRKAAERYRALLELGQKTGVQPLIELWGGSKNLHRLGEVASIAIEADHPNASLLLDLYHLHRGGSDFSGLRLLNGAALHVIHTNDYPDLPVDQLTDAHRVYPGDGVAPLSDIFRTLRETGFRGSLSLELFNRDYWKQSPLKVAQAGIAKMREAVRKSFA